VFLIGQDIVAGAKFELEKTALRDSQRSKLP
jgi:hypothetical protein